jgi:deoxyadenosine/deoxycytidine kinase
VKNNKNIISHSNEDKPLIIALSGACHSGKSTFANELENSIKNVESYDEVIRDYDFGSIDDVRENPEDYLQVQFEIICRKIKQEEQALKYSRDKIILFDRSLVDSLYYYTYYVDKSRVNTDVYNDFLETLICKLKAHIEKVYDLIFLFEPIKITDNADDFRPKDLIQKQRSEYEIIKSLTYGFCRGYDRIVNINVEDRNNLDYFKKIVKAYNSGHTKRR